MQGLGAAVIDTSGRRACANETATPINCEGSRIRGENRTMKCRYAGSRVGLMLLLKTKKIKTMPTAALFYTVDYRTWFAGEKLQWSHIGKERPDW